MSSDLLRAIEGSFAPIACLETPENECERYHDCATVGFWEGMYKVISDYVDSVSLKQLIDEEAMKKGIQDTAASCMLLKELGLPSYFSKGSEENLKITTVDDLKIFKALLNTRQDEWIKK